MRHFYEKGASFCAGVDLSCENLEIAKAGHKAAGIPESMLSYHQADLTKPKPIAGEKFDVVTSCAVVCYAGNQQELQGFMSMAYTNLKAGGRFIVINTRQALPVDMRDELESLVGVRYDIEPKESFLPMVGEWPNGWKGYCNYIHQDNVEKALIDAGFSVERRSLLVDPNSPTHVDVKRISELVPYNAFVAIKPL
jgi:2-polyprenyl-3-methyl-5-hydroxy-6-metoxy-1,4-benzoquinol methylase